MKGTWFNHDLIFPNEIGRPFEETNLIRRSLRPILAKMWPAIDDAPDPAAKNITLYSLRHSCATILLMLGENPKVVSDRLGHASVVQTLDTYSHVLPHIQEAATDKMERDGEEMRLRHDGEFDWRGLWMIVGVIALAFNIVLIVLELVKK
jgi:integrase